jgi:hypothetical protein
VLDASTILTNLDCSLMREIRIEAKLQAVAAYLDHRDDLRSLVDRLVRGESTAEQHLEVYRAIRRAGVLPPEAGFFLVAQAIGLLADARIYNLLGSDALFVRIRDRVEEIRQSSLSGSSLSPTGEEPAELGALDAAWTWHADDIHAAIMREHGDAEMADLFLNDRDEYRRRYEAGRRFFLDDAE